MDGVLPRGLFSLHQFRNSDFLSTVLFVRFSYGWKKQTLEGFSYTNWGMWVSIEEGTSGADWPE